MSRIRLIIAGTRRLKESQANAKKIQEHLEKLGWHGKIEAVLSSGDQGVSRVGERYARMHNIEIWRFKARWRWDKGGAGANRNQKMAGWATHCLVIWDGKDSATRSLLKKVKKAGVRLEVRTYKPPPPSLPKPKPLSRRVRSGKGRKK